MSVQKLTKSVKKRKKYTYLSIFTPIYDGCIKKK